MRRLHYMRGCIMRARRSLSFVSATAVAWAICASAAAAQAADDPQTPTQVAQATAPGASAAQDSRSEIAQSENQAGEIVVPANKREQNLNTVGRTISELTGESLANQRIANVQALEKATPGLRSEKRRVGHGGGRPCSFPLSKCET